MSSADTFTVAGRTFRSRLLVGTGKYKDMDETRDAIAASGAEIVTIAVRRTNIGQDPNEPNVLDVLPPDRFTILPNTAGCYDAETAVRPCRLAREMLDGHNLVKLEVLGDEKTLFPDVIQTLGAAEELIKDGFDVMVYTNDDPIIARQLEDMGCVAVMPLAAPIGSGLGIAVHIHKGYDPDTQSYRRYMREMVAVSGVRRTGEGVQYDLEIIKEFDPRRSNWTPLREPKGWRTL